MIGIDGAEPVQRLVDGEDVDLVRRAESEGIVERHLLQAASALGGRALARVVDEDASHQLRGDAEKMRAVLPAYVTLIDQLHERFVDERGRLERVLRPLLT